MQYPGRLIKTGEKNREIVKAVKLRLNEVLGSDPVLRLDAQNGSFGPKMMQTVKLFQARNVDSDGRSLKQDGEIGSLTWAALFGARAVPVTEKAESPLLASVVRVASAEEAKQVREVPPNSNRGKRVEEYQSRTGSSVGLAWCCSFVYWCFDEAANAAGRKNPMVKIAGCLDHWNRAPGRGAQRIAAAQAVKNPALVSPGMIFIMDHGKGRGHTGLVEKVTGGLITTIEGNTDASKTREGGGVYRLNRKMLEINKGFIDYGRA